MEGRFNGGFFWVTGLGGLYLEGLIHGGAYFRNFTVLGALQNYNDDSNRNVKKSVGLLRKTTLYMHHAFLYISLRSLHNYNMK